MKRQRGRSRRSSSQSSNRSMESNGPDVKVRGNAKQIFDKYEALARDASSSGNRVKAENYRQHAEHYLRMVNAIEDAKQQARDEREEQKAEQGSADAESGEDNNESKSRRRYPPRTRRSSDDSAAETGDGQAGSDVTAESGEDSKVKVSTSRRKAPSRKAPEDAEPAPVEAAE